MKNAAVVFLAVGSLIGSCSHRVPTATVELIDTSLSISPRAEAAALKAVQKQVEEMGRGDRLILVPVTGDAKNDAGGRVLRLQAPTMRETYDTDLKRFQTEAKNQFSAWATMHGAEEGRTDLLGSIEVARQEITSLPAGIPKRLIIASDFIEDDGEFHFATDQRVGDSSRAHELAASSAGVTVCLGRLESSDYGALLSERRQAIDAFWQDFLASTGTGPGVQIDGIGLLENPDNECPASVASHAAGGGQ
jgi:hypothetical protein